MEDVYEKLLEENYKLVYSYLHSKNLDITEWESIISYSLWKAIKSHDSSRGTLSTLFYKIAGNDVISELRSMKFDYLDEAVDSVDYAYIGEPDDHLLLEMEDAAGEYGWLVPYAVLGYTQKEIAELMGCDRSTISMKLHSMREKIREEFDR